MGLSVPRAVLIGSQLPSFRKMSSSGKVAETFNPSVGQPRRTSLCTTFASQARVTGLGLSYLEHSDAQACYGQFSSHGLEWDDIWTISNCDLCPDGGATNQTFSIERDRLLEDQVGRLGRKDVVSKEYWTLLLFSPLDQNLSDHPEAS